MSHFAIFMQLVNRLHDQAKIMDCDQSATVQKLKIINLLKDFLLIHKNNLNIKANFLSLFTKYQDIMFHKLISETEITIMMRNLKTLNVEKEFRVLWEHQNFQNLAITVNNAYQTNRRKMAHDFMKFVETIAKEMDKEVTLFKIYDEKDEFGKQMIKKIMRFLKVCLKIRI